MIKQHDRIRMNELKRKRNQSKIDLLSHQRNSKIKQLKQDINETSYEISKLSGFSKSFLHSRTLTKKLKRRTLSGTNRTRISSTINSNKQSTNVTARSSSVNYNSRPTFETRTRTNSLKAIEEREHIVKRNTHILNFMPKPKSQSLIKKVESLNHSSLFHV